MHSQLRREDRRSCHNLSFLLGLAVLARDPAYIENCFVLLVRMTRPIAGQEPS